MPDSSAIPVRRIFDARQAKAKTKVEAREPSSLPSISPAGPRKLVRPPMPAGAANNRGLVRLSPLSSLQTNHHLQGPAATRGESSHAEAFYFQKQIHSQTLMVFVLEDGEQIEGQIEWYDRDAIKVKQGNLRTLIYKSGIKYLFKAADKAASV
jgi:sRNA-binding regulator protein Hfq